MSSSASRKRAAPGGVPMPPGSMPPQPQTYTTPEQNQMMRWNYNNAANMHAMPQQQQQQQQPQLHQQQNQQQMQQQNQQPVSNVYPAQTYDSTTQPQQRMHHQQPAHQSNSTTASSNRPAHRTNNDSLALVPSRSSFENQPDTQWPSAENALVPTSNAVDPEQQQLMEAVAKAEKIAEEAQSDRPGANKKSIPPFVLKLATFLNRRTNPDLIRWSDKGDSFVVLDEDEFARTMIPQLFKHANYASFVRQLNMYGFHKRVGLADNSMRSSEKKNKAPSEYAHQYFRRGYDVLQWLIQKPNKKKLDAAKRKAAGGKRDDTYEFDSDEEYDDPQAYAVPGTIAKTELSKFKEQFAEIHAKQQQSLAMIQQLRSGQNEIMQKAHQVELQHQRHENSINQILNFLANVFRKSLEGKSADHLAELLSGIVNMQGQGGGIPTGSVQDLGDMSGQGNFDPQQNGVDRNALSLSPVPRHRQHLLPGIPADNNKPSASRTDTPTNHSFQVPSGYQAPSVAQATPRQDNRVTELYDTSPEDTTSPNEYYRNELEANPEEAIMKLMGATNARMNSGSDLRDAAANTPASMSIEQRRHMMHSISQHASNSQQNKQQRMQTPNMPSTIASGVQQGNQPNITAQPPTATVENHVQTPSYNDNTVGPPMNLAFSPGPEVSVMQDANQAQYNLQLIESQQQDVQEGINDLANLAALLTPGGHIADFDGAGDTGYFNNNGLVADNNDASNQEERYDPTQWLHTEEPSSFFDPNDPNEPANFDFDLGDIDGVNTFGMLEDHDPANGNFNSPVPGNHASPQTGVDESRAMFNGDGGFQTKSGDELNLQDTGAHSSSHLGVGQSSIKTSDTPSPAVTEEIERDDLADLELPPTKRQRAL